MKTILVPTDFSKCSLAAVKYAIQLTKKTKNKIVFFHSTSILIPTISSNTVYMETVSSDKIKKEKILNTFITKAYKSLNLKRDEKKTRCVVKSGTSVVEHILKIVREQPVDMIIMGTLGASGIKEMLFGSNTAKIISSAPCPVIAVPEKVSFNKVEKIAYATDYHPEDVDVLKQLVTIAKPFNAKINVIHIADGEYVLTREKEWMKEFEKQVKQKSRYKFISYQLLYNPEILKTLEHYIKKESVSLFALSTRHRNLVERLFSKSITKKLVYHTKVPLMAFHHKQ